MKQNQSNAVAGKASRRKLNKSFLVLLSLVLLVSIAGGATLAYLISEGGAVENSFVPGSVDCQVNTGDYTVSLTDQTNTTAYVRVAVVATWQKDGVVYANVNNNIQFNTGDQWTYHDGYYYYEVALDPDGVDKTSALAVNGFSYNGDMTDIPAGYSLCVDLLAEAIQAKGSTDEGNELSYRDSWGAAIWDNG